MKKTQQYSGNLAGSAEQGHGGAADVLEAPEARFFWRKYHADSKRVDNAFFMQPGEKVIQFIPFSTATTRASNLHALVETLRVEDLSMYRSLAACNDHK